MDGKKRYKKILHFTVITYFILSCLFSSIASASTINTSFNPEIDNSPYKPTNPQPSNNSIDQSTTITLQVYVTDPDNDTIYVYFYNAADDSLIGSDVVANGSNATIVWNGLSYGTTYNWYAIANDSIYQNISDTWNFKTIVQTTPTPPSPSPSLPPVINQPPVANITGEKEGYINQNITFFANKSYDPDENYPLKYYWDLDNDGLWDTDAMEESVYIHQFQTTGEHTIRLMVKDSLGAKNYTTYKIKINELSSQKQFPKPKINGRYEGIINQPIKFTSKGSYDPDGNITKYIWYFGDGNTSNKPNPTHTYDKKGYYIVILKVTDNDNLSSTIWTTATIYNTSSEIKNNTNNNLTKTRKQKPENFIIIVSILSIILVTIIISYVLFKRKELNDEIKKIQEKNKTQKEEIKKPEITMLLTKNEKTNNKGKTKKPKPKKKTNRKKTPKPKNKKENKPKKAPKKQSKKDKTKKTTMTKKKKSTNKNKKMK